MSYNMCVLRASCRSWFLSIYVADMQNLAFSIRGMLWTVEPFLQLRYMERILPNVGNLNHWKDDESMMHGHENQLDRPSMTGWWFQPIWKILVKVEIFPK